MGDMDVQKAFEVMKGAVPPGRTLGVVHGRR